ncbi:hypothetical protein [Parabacteroides sp. PF5-6]|uniref:hypothetical protein n=1 Tax=Parabacteroides sp. PF5-6 TaxID=1742403 RepID=UPI0024061AA1|nr:hypothetical protein [Parabacteroides sp. PF5-6]
MLTTLLLTGIIIVICVALLAIKVIVKKGGEFPNTHVSGNKALREKGISCTKTQQRQAERHKNLEERMKEAQ